MQSRTKVEESKEKRDPQRQSWYNVRRIAQRILRHPEDVNRLAQQIISTADSQLEK
jgi:hypothetical protein